MKEESKSNAKSLIKDVAFACAIALVISIFVRPTIVKERSMEPSVYENDVVILSKQEFKIRDVKRGDVVIFDSDIKQEDNKHNKRLIKRVIGLPGDIITISEGKVYRNGEMLEEDYIEEGGTPGEIYNFEVPKGEYFVMGDHREVSLDSRKLGTIKKGAIKGKAIFKIFPFNKIKVL